MTTELKVFARVGRRETRPIVRFMLDWVREDIAIAKAAPIWDADRIEALRREEARWERELEE